MVTTRKGARLFDLKNMTSMKNQNPRYQNCFENCRENERIGTGKWKLFITSS
jgi:hypothetical protein